MAEKQPAPEIPGLTIVEASQVAEEDKASLTVDWQDDELVLKARDGDAVPSRIRLTDADGNTVATYVLAPAGRAAAAPYAEVTDPDGGEDWQIKHSPFYKLR
ncbi:hypothetical protein [Streptomyces sp. Da 82-17]|uniref:hypothetical protein n=1 Tax=Streptomyces sp. Da 82-17 TaxID=3377116 RepID=UPI0038D40FB2